MSLEGVHDYALLLPPEQCRHQMATKNKIYERRFDSDNKFNVDEHDGCAGDSDDGSGVAVLTFADADMNQLREHQRQTQREDREPRVRRRSRTPARGGSPAYSRDKTPSRRDRARSRGSSNRCRHRKEESPESGRRPQNEPRGRTHCVILYDKYKQRARTPSTNRKKCGHQRVAGLNQSSGTPMSSPLQKTPKLKSLVSRLTKAEREEEAPVWDTRTPQYHFMLKQPEKFIEWLVTDLPPGHYEAEIRSIRHFGKQAETLAHRIIATCAWAMLCHVHSKPYIPPFIPRELFETDPDPKISSLPEKPDLNVDDLRE